MVFANGGGDARAVDVFWDGGVSDDWSDPGNWNTATVPGTGDNAVVDNGLVSRITTDVSAVPGAIDNLFIDNASELEVATGGALNVLNRTVVGSRVDTSGTLTLSGGTLDVGGEVAIGENGGFGTVNQTAGDFNFATGAALNAGFSLGGTGTGVYNMQGGTLSQVGGDPDSPLSWNYIGRDADGNGTLNLSDGTISFGALTALGGANGATGTVNQTGGTFEVRDRQLVLGDDGTGIQSGVYDMSGGTLRVGDDLSVANGRNSSGMLTISGTAAVEVGDIFRIGQGDPDGSPADGVVVQTGGTVDVITAALVGVQPGATGLYDISGGTIATNQAFYVGALAGGQGTLNLSGTGDVTANEQMAIGIGPGSAGVVNQTGGVLRVVNPSPDVDSVIWVGTELPGSDVGADGEYNLSGGSAIVDGFLSVGEAANTSGRFNVSDTGDLTVGVALQVGGQSDVDDTSPGFRAPNTGHFNQTGGSVNVLGQLQIGVGETSTGVYEQTAGDLTVGGIVFMGILENSTLPGGEVDEADGTLNISGGTTHFVGELFLPDDVRVSAVIGFEGVGTINQDGGTFSVDGQFVMGAQILAGGPTGDGTYNMTSGTSTFGADAPVFLGATGTGLIHQTGGSIEMNSNLQIGNDPGSAGTYDMSDGTLVVNGATFLALDSADSGGGNVVKSTGDFNMSDGQAEFNESIFVGVNGDASFNQTGGVLFTRSASGDDFIVGLDRLSDAELNISGGEAFVDGRILVGVLDSQNARLVISGDALLSTGGDVFIGDDLDDFTDPNDVVDNNGFVLHSGGTFEVGLDLILGKAFFDDGNIQAQSNGVYNLSGGSLTVSGATVLGSEGFGLFTQTGGEHEVFDMPIAINATSSGTYQLQGGVLNMLGGAITIGNGQPAADDFFEFTGGVLRDAGVIDFSLVNAGGAIEPGASAGLTLVNGDYTVTSPDAAYNVEIGGLFAEFDYDVLDVLDTATLDGILNVTLIDGFEPVLGDTFDVLLAGVEVVGTFATENFPSFNGLTFHTNYFSNLVQLEVIEDLGPMCIAGDTSDCDGVVNIDDLNAVRNLFGTGDGSNSNGIPGDTFPFDGFVNIDDLNSVRNNFGTMAPAPVPEPGTLRLILLAVIGCLLAGVRLRSAGRWHGALVLLALACSASTGQAANIFWEGGVSDQWDNADNWIGALLPGTGDNAIIGNAAISQVSMDVSSGPGPVDNVFINGNSQVDVVAGGFLQVGRRMSVGNLVGTSGTLNIEDGGIEVGAGIDVGENAGSGTANQAGGDVLFATAPGVVAGLRVGASSTGTYIMTGGTLSQFDAPGGNPFSRNYIGLARGVAGIFNLFDGVVTFVAPTIVGGTSGASGVVHQSGGLFEVAGGSSLILGDDGETADGQYNLSGGDLLVEFNSIVADVGIGQFHQTGGTHTTTNLTLAVTSTAQGLYELDDGVMDASAGALTIGIEGTAIVRQAGGELHAMDIDMAALDGANGSYGFSGGTLNVANAITVGLGGIGVFDQGGGQVNTTDVALGLDRADPAVDTGDGTYQLSAGSLNSTGTALVGGSGRGFFVHNGGDHMTTGMVIADNATSQGTYQLSGGVLDLGGGDITAGDGAPAATDFFDFSGGVLRNVGSIGFSLTNSGGAIQPGASAGTTVIDGDFTFTSAAAAYDAEIGGLIAGAEYDQIDVIGAATLDGILNVSLIDAFSPVLGDVFTILTADSLSGGFAEVNVPVLDSTLDWQINYLADAVELEIISVGALSACGAGDTSPCDGLVNLDDLNLVRNHFGAAGEPGLPGDTFPFDGLVNIDDLNAVRNLFGAAPAAVPEPATLAMALIGLLCCACRRRMLK